MVELQETGGGAEMWTVEAVEGNQSVSLHRVKTKYSDSLTQLQCFDEMPVKFDRGTL